VTILQEHHIAYGLKTQEDDHVITLGHRNRVIARWSTTGILSRDEIIKEADKYISGLVNQGRRREDIKDILAEMRGDNGN